MIIIANYYYTLDCEWVADNSKRIKYPEILSIGVVKLNSRYETVDTFYRVIKPTLNQEIPQFTLDLTKLTVEEIEDGISFGDCIDELEGFLGNDQKCKLYAWGEEDRLVFFKNLRYAQKRSFIPHRIYDVQPMICPKITYKGHYISNQFSIDDLQKVYNITDLKGHNALNDAMSLGLIFKHFKTNSKRDESTLEYLFKEKYHRDLLCFNPSTKIIDVEKLTLVNLKTLLMNHGIPKDSLFQFKKEILKISGLDLTYPIDELSLSVNHSAYYQYNKFHFDIKHKEESIGSYYLCLTRERDLKRMKRFIEEITKEKTN